jgi:hypothetical protein
MMGLTFGIRKPLFSGQFSGVPKPTLYRTPADAKNRRQTTCTKQWGAPADTSARKGHALKAYEAAVKRDISNRGLADQPRAE